MLISDSYRALNAELHRSNPSYGVSGKKWAPHVRDFARTAGAGTILDYGCGKQTLAQALPELKVIGYDPAIPGLDAPPAPADLVVCGDVLEHIEPELLDHVLDDLRRVTVKALFIVVATRPAMKTLADGRNAHLIQQPSDWWLPRLLQRFSLRLFQEGNGEFSAVLVPKARQRT